MPTQDLSITIEANVQNALKSIEAFYKSLEEIPEAAGAASKSVDKLPASIGPAVTAFSKLKTAAGSAATVFNGASLGVAKFIPPLEKLTPAATKAGTSLTALGKTGNSATLALTNLGRVAQDAPFGFIGISNNLNPLLESFQRLKAETGSTGGALKALGGSLMGAGGIGLALSAITAAVTFAQIGFRSWGGATGKSKDEVDEAKKSLDEFNKSLKDAEAGAIKTGVNLQAFVAIARDNTKSLEERNYALKEANKLLGDHGEKLTLVNINTAAVTDEVNRFTKALVAQAVAAKLSDRLADVIIKVKDLQKEYTKAVDVFNDPKVQRSKFTGSLFSSSDFDDAKANVKATVTNYKAGITELQKLQNDFTSTIAESANLFGELGFSEKSGVAKKGKEFSDFVQKLQIELQALTGAAAGDPFAQIKKSTAQLFQQFEKLKKDGKLTAEDIIDAPGIINAINSAKVAAENIKLFDAETKTAAKRSAETWALVYKTSLDKALSNIVPAVPEISAKDATDSLKTALAGIDAQMSGFGLATTTQLKTLSDQITAVMRDTAANAATAIGDGIGDALSGQKNPFEDLIGVLGAGVKALGQVYIKLGVEMAIAQKAIKAIANNPYLTIAAGVALQALGQIMQNKARSQTKLAEGGIVSGPMNAAIGEAGQSEVVIPLSRLSGMLNNNNSLGGHVEFQIAGSNLLGVLTRATASRSRTHG